MSDPRPDPTADPSLSTARRVLLRGIDEYLARTAPPVEAPSSGPPGSASPDGAPSVLARLRRRFARDSEESETEDAPGEGRRSHGERGAYRAFSFAERADRGGAPDPETEDDEPRPGARRRAAAAEDDAERTARDALDRVVALLDGIEGEPLSANIVWTHVVRDAIEDRGRPAETSPGTRTGADLVTTLTKLAVRPDLPIASIRSRYVDLAEVLREVDRVPLAPRDAVAVATFRRRVTDAVRRSPDVPYHRFVTMVGALSSVVGDGVTTRTRPVEWVTETRPSPGQGALR